MSRRELYCLENKFPSLHLPLHRHNFRSFIIVSNLMCLTRTFNFKLTDFFVTNRNAHLETNSTKVKPFSTQKTDVVLFPLVSIDSRKKVLTKICELLHIRWFFNMRLHGREYWLDLFKSYNKKKFFVSDQIFTVSKKQHSSDFSLRKEGIPYKAVTSQESRF